MSLAIMIAIKFLWDIYEYAVKQATYHGVSVGSGDETTATWARPSTVCMQMFVQSDQ